MYRVAVEAILGIHVRGDTLEIKPCIPARWPAYQVTYRFRSATYRVQVDNAAGTGRNVRSITMDGQPASDMVVPLRDDGRTHDVHVVLG
jgi:cellobiose phosphorylase